MTLDSSQLGDILIEIELDPSVFHLAKTRDEKNRDLNEYLLKYSTDILADLKIPANITLNLSEEVNLKNQIMNDFQVKINEEVCRLPFLHRSIEHLDAQTLARDILIGIYKNLELFLSESLVKSIKEKWTAESNSKLLSNLSLEDFHSLLKELVSRYFRINKIKDTIIKTNESGLEELNKSWILEESTAGWDVHKVKLFLNNLDEFDSIKLSSEGTNFPVESIEDMFIMMRDGLFYELGILLPQVKFIQDKSLDDNEFRVQINDLRFYPKCRILRNYFLVNDTVDRLALLNIEGKHILNPANDSECAIVKNENNNEELCMEAGLTTWKPEGFVVLSVSALVRKNAAVFMNKKIVEHMLMQLNLVFPDLIDAVKSRYSNDELTAILRGLLKEEISIRNLRTILEALLDSEHHKEKPLNIENTVDSIRIGLKRYITNKYTRSSNTLVTYLLEKELEELILSIDRNSLRVRNKNHDLLIKSLYAEYGKAPPTAQTPIILTTYEVRNYFRKLIAKEFPWVAVLSYQELSPDMNIQPIGKISKYEEEIR